MEEYKKYVDHQHAPESLIADTIKKVKAEEARKAQTIIPMAAAFIGCRRWKKVIYICEYR